MPGFQKDQEKLATGTGIEDEKLPLIASQDPLWRQIFCIRLAALLQLFTGRSALPPLTVISSAGFASSTYRRIP